MSMFPRLCKESNMKSLSVLFFLCHLFVSCGFGEDQIDKFGLKFNSQRKLLGLPPLDKTWKLVKNAEDVLIWHPPAGKDSLSFVSKLVQLDEGKIRKEDNQFLGQQRYHTVDGDMMEELYYGCYFDENGHLSRWSCKYWGPGYEYGENMNKIQADSILKKWRIKPLF